MFQGTEQFAAAQRAFVETAQQVGYKQVECANKLVELNVQTTKTLLTEASDSVNGLLQARDLAKFNETAQQIIQPAAQKAAAYARHAYDIVVATQQEIVELIAKRVEEANDLANDYLDNVAKSAPAGSEPAFNAARQSLAAVRGAFDQAVETQKQLAATAEEEVTKTVKAASKATRAAA